MAPYLEKRGTIYLRHQLSHMARLATCIATSKRPAAGVSPRHECGLCRGHLGSKKSLFCEFSQNKATHFPQAGSPPARLASDTFGVPNSRLIFRNS
jgi:hypothetical protein